MARIPIVHVGRVLIATVQEDLYDRDVVRLQEELSTALERSAARGVLIDLSVVQIVDSFLGRLINDIAASSRLLGAETVVVGIQPAVAMTLVELGLELKGVRTALNAAKGMAILERRLGERPARGRRDGR